MKNLRRVTNVTKSKILRDCFFELSIKDNKKYKSIYENKKENVFKNSDNKNKNNVEKICIVDKNVKKLWQVTLYENKSQFTSSDLLQEYNNIKTDKTKKDNYNVTSQLYSLYNTLYNELYNWQTRQDLLWIYKTFYKVNVNNKWQKLSTKDLIEFESSIHYFIMNILDNKITLQKDGKVKKQYIINLYLRFLTSDYTYSIENDLTDWQAIDNNLTSYVNSQYILEKLNINWQVDKLRILLQDKQVIIDNYKQVLMNIKTWLIDKKDKQKLQKEYNKKIALVTTNIKNLIKRINVTLYE